jgi:hypothetical protein
LQKQQQLRRIQLLAPRSEEPPHQQVDLLPQPRVFLLQSIETFVAGLQFSQQLSFTR